jgi:hypothetical protein
MYFTLFHLRAGAQACTIVLRGAGNLAGAGPVINRQS